MTDQSGTGAFDGRAFARELTSAPGVYRMLAADGSVLYVGKAAALNQRVASYFSKNLPSARIAAMVAQIASIEVTVTRTASEALILENQLIKSLKPRYNVLLRDNKSYPHVLLTDETWPRLAYHRGARLQAGRYFGPYPAATAVRQTLEAMFKLFRLRSCEDSVFRNRSRPCLQHQIGRCSAPCVGLISPREYAADVRRAALFLEGRSHELVDELTAAMEQSSQRLDFEQAAQLRDRIAGIRGIQAEQHVESAQADLDVLACALERGVAAISLLAFRHGMNYGTRNFFPRVSGGESAEEVLTAFVGQYYEEQRPPREVLLSHALEDSDLIEAALSERAGHRVRLRHGVRSDRARLLGLARQNAANALATELASSASQKARLEGLQTLLGLAEPPGRIECFDISHTQGEATVAACVVFGPEGAQRGLYRRYNISGVVAGDDYAAMRQALDRRFKRGVEEGNLPDLLLIDGGAGQMAQAKAALEEAGATSVVLVGVAKGPQRRAGEETLVFADGRELRPGAASPGLQLIQQIRDEAHRFAITGHRGRRQKLRDVSRLQDIPGIGPRRRASLLKHFGGLSGLKEAGIEEISRVEGISAALADKIYAALHGLHRRDPKP